jgi:MFS family permease
MGLVLAVVGLLGLRGTFVPAGIFVVAGGVLLYLLRDRQVVARTRVVFRRRYSTFYALTLLDGSRRQIFSTFAVFALIRIYHLDVVHITWLLVLNTIVTIMTMPMIGKVIDRAGERKVLTINYACLIFLFAGYALVHNLALLVALYCIDNAFFGFSMGINTYLKKIAPLHEVSPSLVMGTTVNHIAAVGVPLVGGMLWNSYGYQVTFLAGAATCILSVIAALAVHVPAEHGAAEDGVTPQPTAAAVGE